MHESVHVTNTQQCTRTWFEWANALYVVYVENAMGIDCTDAAEELRQSEVWRMKLALCSIFLPVYVLYEALYQNLRTVMILLADLRTVMILFTDLPACLPDSECRVSVVSARQRHSGNPGRPSVLPYA